ncbi:MAG: hypothetical protein LBM75_03960 [Myxococcales bacterium]|jgi:peroxiredoxin family protein|nr:hypothetical protein [Myxococcales bacterium]
MTNRLAIFLHSGDYDRVHQAFSAAVAATSLGREVDLYFFWWALDRLIRDDFDLPNFAGQPSDQAVQRLRQDIDERFAEGQFPTTRQLLDSLRASEHAHLFACSGSLAILGKRANAVEGKVEALVGWSMIFDRTADVVDRFVF